MTPAETRSVVRTLEQLLDSIDAGDLEATTAQRAYLAGVAHGLAALEPPLPTR